MALLWGDMIAPATIEFVKLFKMGLLVVLFLVILAAGAKVASARGLIKPPAWFSKATERFAFVSNMVAPLPPIAAEQVSVLSERLNVVSSHSGAILGDYVKETPPKEPIYNRTLEYGRYLYCQQVVDTYREKHPQ